MIRNRTLMMLTGLLSVQVYATYVGFSGTIPPTVPALETIPERLESWELSRSYSLDPIVVEYLKPDSYVDREYVQQTGSGPVNLFVAYFKSLKSGYGPHSPRHCLPGAGWLSKGSSTVNTPMPDGEMPVNEYWMVKNNQQILVRYWYQNSRRTWTAEVTAKFYLLPDLIRHGRSEVALVRVITPVSQTGLEGARASLSSFIRSVYPFIQEQLPR